MQQLHGYGLPEETRERTKMLIKEGMEGYAGRPYINIIPDTPTCEGKDV